MNYEKKWENMDVDKYSCRTARLKIWGGWIVKSWSGEAVHQIFIKDENHYWKTTNEN